MSKFSIKNILPVVIILAAIGFSYTFMATSPTAPRMESRRISPQVEAFYAERGSSPLFIEELGTLTASQSITLKTKVTGTIASLSPSFEAGSMVTKNTTLLTLDSADYKLALDKVLATLAKVKADYSLEQGQQSVAASDFQQLQQVMPEMKNMSTAEANLALRKPQLEQAKANVAIAEADVATARTNLNDTVLKAPFSGIISTRLASTGQRITSSDSLGELIATDKYHVEVGIAVDTLYSNKILSMDDEDIHIEILSKSGDTWEGNLLQIVGVLATGSRLGKMLLSVDDPLALAKDNEKVPLLLGDQVTVRIEVGVFEDIYVLPRAAVRSNNTIWIIEDGKARNVAVNTIWKDSQNMYVQGEDIPVRAIVLTTDTLNPAEGMELTVSVTNQDALPDDMKSAFAPQSSGRGQRGAAASEEGGEAPQQAQGERTQGQRPEGATGERPANATGERTQGQQRPEGATGERPANAQGERSQGQRPEGTTGERSQGQRPEGTTGERSQGQRPEGTTGERTQGQRPEGTTGERPANTSGEQIQGQRPEGMPMRPLLEEDWPKEPEAPTEATEEAEATVEAKKD